MLRKFLKCHSAATSIEYAVIAALIAIAMLAGLTIVGTSTGKQFNNVANKVSTAIK